MRLAAARSRAASQRISGENPTLINGPKSDTSRAKEVKVKIPMSHHVRLHSMKVLTGKPISDTVTEALEAYFASHPAMGHAFDASFAAENES